ncbi:MAG: Hpt domain-containing protein, partial [Noviherbaspirillum sp.]
PDANDRAQAGIEILDRADFLGSPQALAEIVTATIPVVPASEPLPAVVAPTTDEAIDAELLEIFLSEAEEVLAAVRQALPESRNQPHNLEHLTTLRRSFHTLKGSGRMVGLVSFGEAAWSIEQVLNLRLAESRGGDADLYALLEKAAEILGNWVQDLKLWGKSDSTPQTLVDAAERVKAGGHFVFEEISPIQTPTADAAVVPDVPQIDLTLDLTDAGEEVADIASVLAPEHVLPEAEPCAAPETLRKSPGDNAIDEQQVSLVADDVSETGLSPALPEVEELQLSDADMALFGSGKGSAAVTDLAQTSLVAYTTEKSAPVIAIADVIEFPSMRAPDIKHDDNVKRIGNLEISVPLHNIYLAETDELVRVLGQDIAEWRHEPDRQVNIQSVHAAHSLAGSSATVGFGSLQQVAHALELVLQYLAREPVRLLQHEFDTLEQSVERIKLMLQKFALGEMPAHEPEYARLLLSMRQDIETRSGSQFRGPSSASDVMKATVAVDARQTMPMPDFESGRRTDSGFVASPQSLLDRDMPATLSEHINAEPFAEPVFASENDASADPAMVLKDELDADLLPVFFEEGRDMLPQMGSALREWQERPADIALPQSLLRWLHTLKGSARMAGAMALGQHLHDMETRIENVMRMGTPAVLAIEELLLRHDQGLQMFEHLQNPHAGQHSLDRDAASERHEPELNMNGEREETPAVQESVVLSPLMPLPTDRTAPLAQAAARTVAAPVGPVPMVRVRADILDRLVNQAGEVSISRSKLETEVGTLKQSLSELTENVARLRRQLREIEMQAETQITSRMGQSADREFDPLEFDRFTRLQELTRMMAESVNDVGSVHQNLSRTLDSATGDLSVQARLTRDLQQDLMRVRMVQFASISERLFRVTRQAAKEVDKRVNLDILGSAVEIDRGVLEKMTGPFEHLLRNAIVHGIESREERRAAGKNETGELLVEIRQEGNEVVIHFSDDGQGLN